MPCYHCNKGSVFGRSHTHRKGVAGGRWKKRAPKTQRIFKPNLQVVRIIEEGKKKRVKVCTKCLKRVKKDINDKKKPFLQLAYYNPSDSEKKPLDLKNKPSELKENQSLEKNKKEKKKPKN